MPVSSMLNKLHGQPDSYDKKCVSIPSSPSLSSTSSSSDLAAVHSTPATSVQSVSAFSLDGAILAEEPVHRTPAENDKRRSKYRFGKTLGAGTYGIVREADSPEGKVAVKIILKKNVKGNDQMVYDELEMLQKLKHPHIVKFVDWFESRVGSVATDCERQS